MPRYGGQERKRRPKPAWMLTPRLCQHAGCDRTYYPIRMWQKFCCRKCRVYSWYGQHPRLTVPAQIMPDGQLTITLVLQGQTARSPGQFTLKPGKVA